MALYHEICVCQHENWPSNEHEIISNELHDYLTHLRRSSYLVYTAALECNPTASTNDKCDIDSLLFDLKYD